MKTAKIAFRLPTSLREKIRRHAALEERSEGAFIRFHIGRMLLASQEETEVDDDDDARLPTPPNNP